MALHPGSHNPSGGGSGFISPSSPSQGLLSVPQPGIMPGGTPSPEALSEIVQMIRGGQVGAERFLEVLDLLARQTAPASLGGQQQGPAGAPPSPSELLG